MFSRKFIIRTLAVIGLYVAAVSYIFQNEEWFFFDHVKIESSEPYSFTLPYQELNIKINDDIQLHGLHFQQDNPKGMVLYFPSGDYLPNVFSAHASVLYQQGYDVIIPEYRGIGKSTSVFSTEDDIYSDAKQWFKMANRMSDSLNLIVYGKGFGTGVAAYLGAESNIDLVILENSYFSWSELMLKKYFWWAPHSYLTQYQIPVWEFVRKSTNKTILIHDADHDFIDYSNSERLLEYLKPGDNLITLNGDDKKSKEKVYKENINRILSKIEK